MSKTIRVTLDIVVDTDLTSADEILEDVPEVNNFYIV